METFKNDVIGLTVEYLNKKYDTNIDTQYYANIRTWREWWEGYVKDVHSYIELGVDNAPRMRELYRLGMAKRITEDWASLLLNEKTTIQAEDKTSKTWLFGDDNEQGTGGVFGDSNFWAEGNELLEKAFAYGTGAFVARASGAKVNKDGVVVPDKECKAAIEYIDALSIIPLSVEKSRITEVAFVSEFTRRGKKYVYLETHTKADNGNYQIENEYFLLDGTQLKSADIPENIAPLIDTGSPRPWFAFIYPNITCNIRTNNGLGMSVYANALDNLKAVDIAFNNFVRDFKLGGKKVFYNKSMLMTNTEGKIITPDDVVQQLFQQVGDGIDFDAKQMVQEFNPSLRVQENKDGVQAQLDYLSFKCGMGTKRYQFENSGIKTATEYSGEKQELVQHANRHVIILESALKTLCRALLYIGKAFCGADVDPDTPITVSFEDGFIIDDNAAKESDRQDVRDGLKQAWEYRVKWYNETEEEAKAVIDGMKTAIENPFNFGT
ncbi:MAG: phage portal protein [Clostridia bacterium]|nr:phage portal protein [Clostridia bacterium]